MGKTAVEFLSPHPKIPSSLINYSAPRTKELGQQHPEGMVGSIVNDLSVKWTIPLENSELPHQVPSNRNEAEVEESYVPPRQ